MEWELLSCNEFNLNFEVNFDSMGVYNRANRVSLQEIIMLMVSVA